jgi:F420H(2)-dependent quinone reductase
MASNELFRTLNRIHIFLYRSSGGKILGRIVGSPVLLLTTTGRKSGKPRTIPLVYLVDGENYVVIASDDPAWHKNLQNRAPVSIEVQKQKIPVVARDAKADEVQRLWAKIVAQSPAFKSSMSKPNHQLVVLERANS